MVVVPVILSAISSRPHLWVNRSPAFPFIHQRLHYSSSPWHCVGPPVQQCSKLLPGVAAVQGTALPSTWRAWCLCFYTSLSWAGNTPTQSNGSWSPCVATVSSSLPLHSTVHVLCCFFFNYCYLLSHDWWKYWIGLGLILILLVPHLETSLFNDVSLLTASIWNFQIASF